MVVKVHPNSVPAVVDVTVCDVAPTVMLFVVVQNSAQLKLSAPCPVMTLEITAFVAHEGAVSVRGGKCALKSWLKLTPQLMPESRRKEGV